MPYRTEKIKELIRQLASEFIERESSGSALVTVTGTKVSDDYKEAVIFITVYPDDKEKAVLDFLKRHRSEFKHYVREKGSLGRLPFFDFEIDFGEKNRQRIDSIANKL